MELRQIYEDAPGRALSSVFSLSCAPGRASEALSVLNFLRRHLISEERALKVRGVTIMDSINYLENRKELREDTTEVVRRIQSLRLRQEGALPQVVHVDRQVSGELKAGEILGDLVDPEDSGLVLFTAVAPLRLTMSLDLGAELLGRPEEPIYELGGVHYVRVHRSFSPVRSVAYEGTLEGSYLLRLETSERVDHWLLVRRALASMRDLLAGLEASAQRVEVTPDSRLEDLGLDLKSLAQLRTAGFARLSDLVERYEEASRLVSSLCAAQLASLKGRFAAANEA